MARSTGLLLVLACGLAWAQAPQTREYPLKYCQAAELCRALGGDVAAGAPLTAAEEATTLAQRMLAGLPNSACQWLLDVRATNFGALSSPDQTATAVAPLQKILPPGLSGPPKALLDRNALSASGTEDALTKLGEIVKMLDRPAQLVRFDVRLLDPAALGKLNLGADWNYTGASTANATAFARVKLETALPAGTLRALPTATVVLANNRPGDCTFSEYYPHYLAQDGKLVPRVLYSVLRLGLVPRINADQSVTFYLAAESSMGLATTGQTIPPFVNATWNSQARVTGDTLLVRPPRAQADDATERWLAAQPQLGRRHLLVPLLAITPTILETIDAAPTRP